MHNSRTLRVILFSAGALLLSLLGIKYLLPLVLPPLLGLLTALLIFHPIRQLQSRFSLRYGTAAILCISGVFLLAGILLLLLGFLLGHEVRRLSGQLPELISAAAQLLSTFGAWASQRADRLPGSVGEAFRSWSERIVGSSGTLYDSVSQWLFSAISGILGKLPDLLLFSFTFVLSVYFAALELPRLLDFMESHLPQKRKMQLHRLSSGLKAALGGWLRAQLKLMGITFLILFAGFLLLRADSPLFFALSIALLDALPVFGTGTVLIPWSIISMLTENLHFGIGLILIYASAALCRNILEPKLLGDQMGLSPLFTLLAIYAGYRISGVGGMLLFPIAAMVAAELYHAGKAPLTAGESVPDFAHKPQPG